MWQDHKRVTTLTDSVDTKIYSFEDIKFSKGKELIEKYNKSFFSDRELIYVIVNRDPLNLYASRYKRPKFGGFKTFNEIIDINKEHLNISMSNISNVVDINFNEWFSNIDYRKVLCEKLKLQWGDKGLSIMYPMVGESSWDGRKFESSTQSMDVLNRYKHYKNSKKFAKFFDKNLKLLTLKYYGINIDKLL